MGYMTFHDLTWDVPEDSAQEQAIMDWIEADGIKENFEDLYPGGACGLSKWYDANADMLRLSKAFLSVLFTLSGSGEEETDLWRSYYRGGMVQHAPAQVTYPPFDPAKLADPADSDHAARELADEVVDDDSPEADALANNEVRNGPWS